MAATTSTSSAATTNIAKEYNKKNNNNHNMIDFTPSASAASESSTSLLSLQSLTRRSSSNSNQMTKKKSNNDEPAIWEKWWRRWRVFACAAQLFVSYKWVQWQEGRFRRNRKKQKQNQKGSSSSRGSSSSSQTTAEEEEEEQFEAAIDELWNRAHVTNAQRLLSTIQELQGFWIKLGQYLSSRADVMPTPYLETLASLQDSVPAKPWSDIQQTLLEQWTTTRASPSASTAAATQAAAQQWIAAIDPQPLSTASLAQVHKAQFTDGRWVVLKVQHRGVASLMMQDMENLRTILRLLATFEPDMDYNPVVREYTTECRKELDFRLEAQNMEEVRDLLRRCNIRAKIPAIWIPELVTEKVLVMEFCEGFPIRNVQLLDEHDVDRRLLLERVCSAWAAQMHVGGTFNADPHPGNILVSTAAEDGDDTSIPILLDFGLTKRFSPAMKIAFARLVHASHETDIDALLYSFEEMGLHLNRYDPFSDMQVMQTVLSDPVPQSQKREQQQQQQKKKRNDKEAAAKAEKEESASQSKNSSSSHGKHPKKRRNPVDAWPAELIFFSRVTALLKGLCSRLDVPYPYLACMAEAARQTLRDTVPAPEHAQNIVYQSEHMHHVMSHNNGTIMTGDVSSSPSIKTRLQSQLEALAVQLVQDDHALGLQICVRHQGQTVVNLAAGTLGTINPRPVTPQSLFNVFSVSKAVLTTGALCMLQDYNISVDEPVAKYWTSGWYTEDANKKQITIRHVLCHQAGLANAFPPSAGMAELTDWSHMKAFIAGPQALPAHVPGTETQYHYLTFAWLVGGLIEEVTGQPYEDYLMKRLIEPLGLSKELHMGGLPEEVVREELAVLTARLLKDSSSSSQNDNHKNHTVVQKRVAQFQEKDKMAMLMNPSVFNMWKIRSAKIPSANGHASAHALATLLDAVTTKGNPFLSDAMLTQATTPQQKQSLQQQTAGSGQGSTTTLLDHATASFGLGYQLHELKKKPTNKKEPVMTTTNGDVSTTTTGQSPTVRSLGHAGFGGSVVLSVPEMQLTMAFTTNQLKLKSVAQSRVLRTILNEFGLAAPASLIAE